MSEKKSWVWESYLVLFSYIILKQAYIFFSADSSIHLYFVILNALNPAFIIKYLLNYYQVVFNLIHLLPLALFIYGKRLFHQDFWGALLIFRIIFDITGHSYELAHLYAAIHSKSMILIGTSLLYILFYIPSYIACYRYAMKKNNIFHRETLNSKP